MIKIIAIFCSCFAWLQNYEIQSTPTFAPASEATNAHYFDESHIMGRITRGGSPVGKGFIDAEVFSTDSEGTNKNFKRSIKVDQDGQFKIDGILSGICRIRYWIGESYTDRVITVAKKSNVNMTIDLPDRAVFGRVSAKGTDTPIQSVVIIMEKLDGSSQIMATTDFKGDFRLLPMDTGTYRIGMSTEVASLSNSPKKFLFGRQTQNINVNNNSEIEVNFKLEPGSSARATVFDTNNKPLKGATVQSLIRIDHDSSIEFPIGGRTDAAGQASFGGFAPGKYIAMAKVGNLLFYSNPVDLRAGAFGEFQVYSERSVPIEIRFEMRQTTFARAQCVKIYDIRRRLVTEKTAFTGISSARLSIPAGPGKYFIEASSINSVGSTTIQLTDDPVLPSVVVGLIEKEMNK